MLKNTLFTTLALAVAVSAEYATTIVSAAAPVTTEIFLAGYDPQQLVGSVIASDSTATTFAVACATGETNCELPADFTFTQGPSTIHYAYTHSAQSAGDFEGTIDVGCTVTAVTGTCSKSVNAILGTITSTATSSTTTFSGASEMGGQILTITGGKFVYPTTASSTSSSPSSSATIKSYSSSYSSASNSSSSFSQYSNSTSASTTVGPKTTPASLYPTGAGASSVTSVGVSPSGVTGGMPMITGNAQWVIGAAGALAAFVAL